MNGFGIEGFPTPPAPPLANASEVERLRFDLANARRSRDIARKAEECAVRQRNVALAAILAVAAFGLGFGARSCHEPSVADAVEHREVRS